MVHLIDFFTSVNLIQKLQFSATGTCIVNRKNMPKFDTKLTKGNSEFHTNKSGIIAARLLDSIEVLVISNCHKQSITLVSRRKKDGSKICVECPEAIANYNETMGGCRSFRPEGLLHTTMIVDLPSGGRRCFIVFFCQLL